MSGDKILDSISLQLLDHIKAQAKIDAKRETMQELHDSLKSRLCEGCAINMQVVLRKYEFELFADRVEALTRFHDNVYNAKWQSGASSEAKTSADTHITNTNDRLDKTFTELRNKLSTLGNGGAADDIAGESIVRLVECALKTVGLERRLEKAVEGSGFEQLLEPLSLNQIKPLPAMRGKGAGKTH